jgi:UDP-N-acetylmuramate dehydrogenase
MIRSNVTLNTWFNVGGPCEKLFCPDSIENFLYFFTKESEFNVLGMCSNVLIRDGGVPGITIKLNKLSNIEIKDEYIIAESGALDKNISLLAARNDIGGFEFLSGIPGSIGGSVFMNAGCYGSDISNIWQWSDIYTNGNIIRVNSIDWKYRSSGLKKDDIILKTCLKGYPDKDASIKTSELISKREKTQPVRAKTGGSTFKNINGINAWKYIDESGFRGYKIGGAQVSELHANFIINTGNATASDIESLILTVQDGVYKKCSVLLETEIKIFGEQLKHREGTR